MYCGLYLVSLLQVSSCLFHPSHKWELRHALHEIFMGFRALILKVKAAVKCWNKKSFSVCFIYTRTWWEETGIQHGAGVGREANRKELFGKILKAQTPLKVGSLEYGKKWKRHKYAKNWKLLGRSQAVTSSIQCGKLPRKEMEKLKGFHPNAENRPSTSLSCVAVSSRRA